MKHHDGDDDEVGCVLQDARSRRYGVTTGFKPPRWRWALCCGMFVSSTVDIWLCPRWGTLRASRWPVRV